MTKRSLKKVFFNDNIKLICHQKRGRSPNICGKQFFLCYRCTGIYLSLFISIIFLFNSSFILKHNFLLILFIFFIGTTPLIIDGYTQYNGLRRSNNFLRFLTGSLFGFTSGFTLIYFIGKLINLTTFLVK